MDGLPEYEDITPPVYESSGSSDYSRFGKFRSYQYSQLDKDEKIKENHLQQPQFIPNITEIITNLKLLKTFGKLKHEFLDNYDSTNKILEDIKWRLFLTIAVKRFIVFVSTLKLLMSKVSTIPRDLELSEDSRSQEFTSMANNLIPPLDVIMVWYSFILNPMTFYDTFTRADMYYFVNYPFPLHIIDSYIDIETFEFKVPEEQKKNYLIFIGKLTKDRMDLVYDPLGYSLDQQMVTIYCPQTKKPITKPIKLIDFIDKRFITKNIGFKFSEIIFENYSPLMINHDQLRKIKLDYDVENPRLLEGTLRYFSKKLSSPGFSNINPEILSNEISSTIIDESRILFRELNAGTPQLIEPTLEEIINRIRKYSPNIKTRVKQSILLDKYKQFNMISLTVSGGIPIGGELVECILRQEKFIKQINDLNWLDSSLIKEGLRESLIRYQRFFVLLTSKASNRVLVPTLDIDLVWHTHQLMLYGYMRDYKYSPCQMVIDHDDSVQENTLDYGYDYSWKLYKQEYGEDYSICFCDYCYIKRNGKPKRISHVFKSKKKLNAEKEAVYHNPLYLVNDNKGITHSGNHKSVSTFISCASRGSILN